MVQEFFVVNEANGPFMNRDKFNIDDPDSEIRRPHLGLLNKIEKSGDHVSEEVIANCLEQKNFSSAAIQLVNALSFHFKCDRVSFGIRTGKHTKLCALSNNASFDRKTNLIRQIEAVMDESIDEASRIIFPDCEQENTTIQVAHAQFVRAQGQREICTIPLRHHGNIIGAIVLERNSGKIFSPPDLQQLERILKLTGPLLHILYLEQRGIGKRIIDNCHHFIIEIFGEKKAASGTLGIISITVLLILTFFHASYRITASAVMEGSIQRVVAAPISGYIATANKRAGDLVHAGDLIASLDDNNLKLEAADLESQKQQLQREFRESLATNDRSKVSVLNARINQIDAKYELTSEQLSRLQLLAPINGIIIDGDLSQSVGSPVTRGDILYKIAPENDYRVILKVDESEISYIKPDQTGKLILSALPGQTLDITITKITPVSISANGHTFFRVEAKLNEKNLHLQPGMEGVGKVIVGERNILWLLTHKVMDKFRLLLWHAWL